MLSSKHKLLEIKTKALVDSLFIWNYKTNFKWRWIEFADYKEYDFSDDVKNIDFIKSQKEWKTLVKLYEEERELSIYFLIDVNSTFFATQDWIKKIDLLYEVLYLLWFSAIKAWDKIWAIIKTNNNYKKIFSAKKWKQNFINIINYIENSWKKTKKAESFFNFFKKEQKDDFDLLNYFNSLKIKKSLVFYFTYNLEVEEKYLKIATLKNDFIYCNLFTFFENNLNWEWISSFKNNNFSLNIDKNNKKKVEKYIWLRKEKIFNLKKDLNKKKSKYFYIDETKNVYLELFNLFKN